MSKEMSEEKNKETGGTIGDALKLKGISLSLPLPVPAVPENKKKENSPSVPSVPAPTVMPKFKLGPPPKISQRKILVPPSEQEREENFKQYQINFGKIASQMYDSVKWTRWYEALPEEEKPLYQAGNDEYSGYIEIKEGIQEMLSYGDWTYREVAVIAYADALVKTCPDYRRWVLSTLDDLVRVSFLVELSADIKSGGDKDGKGKPNGLPMYGGVFNLHELFKKNSSAHKVLASLQNLHERTLEAGHRRYTDYLNELKSEAGEQITLCELKEGKAGRIILDVPDLKRESNCYPLLVESNGHQVTALGAVGAIQRVIEEIMEAGATVPVDKISKDSGLKGKSGTLQAILRRSISAVEKKEQEKIRLTETKAKAEADFQKRVEGYRAQYEADRKELAPLAVLTDSEFLLERKAGLWFMDFGSKTFFEKVSRGEPKKVYGLMAVVERDELYRVRVVRTPNRLSNFFVNDREFKAEGDNFWGLGKFGVVMRVMLNGLQGRGSVEEKPQLVPAVDNQVLPLVKTAEELMAAGVGEDISDVHIPQPEERPEPKRKKTPSSSKKKTASSRSRSR